MKMIDLILAKRSGGSHSREQIQFLVDGIMDGSIPDYQLSAWLMAVCWQGMNMEETANLTDAMCHSGQVLDLSELGSVVAISTAQAAWATKPPWFLYRSWRRRAYLWLNYQDGVSVIPAAP